MHRRETAWQLQQHGVADLAASPRDDLVYVGWDVLATIRYDNLRVAITDFDDEMVKNYGADTPAVAAVIAACARRRPGTGPRSSLAPPPRFPKFEGRPDPSGQRASSASEPRRKASR